MYIYSVLGGHAVKNVGPYEGITESSVQITSLPAGIWTRSLPCTCQVC